MPSLSLHLENIVSAKQKQRKKGRKNEKEEKEEEEERRKGEGEVEKRRGGGRRIGTSSIRRQIKSPKMTFWP